nr:MAG TPA: hypothetical protein [Caudoviricetes sp.]
MPLCPRSFGIERGGHKWHSIIRSPASPSWIPAA